MLVYRALSSNYNSCTYHNEIEAYLNNALCALPSGTEIFNNNTFHYGESRYYHHFFVFAEDAFKFLLTKKNVSDYQISEFAIQDDLVPFYSGFGSGYDFTKIPQYVFDNCKAYDLEFQEILKPTFEIALPTQELKKQYFIMPNSNVPMSNELYEEFELEHYFMLSCVHPTGNSFKFGDKKIELCYRKMYEEYQESLYKEFLEVYNVIFNEQNREFEKFPIYLSKEEIISRQRLLKKYHLGK